MTCRTRQTIVHFRSAFDLPGLEISQPAGNYRVDHDEEVIDGLSWLAWRSTGTFIHLPSIDAGVPTRQMMPIDVTDLETAINKDRSS